MGGVDINSSYSLVNLKTIISEILTVVTNIIATRYDFGLKHQIRELNNYLDDNYYFKKEYAVKISRLKQSARTIISMGESCTREIYIQFESEILKLMKDIDNTLPGIIKDLKEKIYDNVPFQNSLNTLKSVTSDFLSELLQKGHNINFIVKSLNETFEINTCGI